MPDTKPMPAAEFLRQADAMAEMIVSDPSGGSVVIAIEMAHDYLAARAASPVTLEERVILNLDAAYRSGDPVALQAAFMEFNDHARALAEKKGSGHE